MEKIPVGLNHYDLSSLAQSLRFSSVDIIQTQSQHIEGHFFVSPGPVHFYFWKKKGKLIKHQLTLYGQVVEWNSWSGVRTGFLDSEGVYSDTPYLEFDKYLNKDSISQAMDFLSLLKILDKKVQREIIEDYSFYNRYGNFIISLEWFWSVIGNFFKKNVKSFKKWNFKK